MMPRRMEPSASSARPPARLSEASISPSAEAATSG